MKTKSHNHDVTFPWRAVIISLAALAVAAALLIGVTYWQKKQVTPPDNEVGYILTNELPVDTPWQLETLTVRTLNWKKNAKGGSSHEAVVSFSARFLLRENLYSNANLPEAFACAGLRFPENAVRLVNDSDKLPAQTRGLLLARLQETGLLQSDSAEIKGSVIDRRVVNKNAAANHQATVSGTLVAVKKDGVWHSQKLDADWSRLALGDRLEKFGPQTVVAGTDEFKFWAAQVADHAAKFEKIFADLDAGADHANPSRRHELQR